MKNYLSIENLILSSNESLHKVVKSSSEMEGYPITNIFESEDKTIWLSTEELPQEININLFKSFFKEFPKKISAIGIYCWHAYPTNPKLIEVQISKNKGQSFVSLGNFDLCLKPGRQLLQLEDDSDYILSKDIDNNNIIIKLIIKETFGDKRTYINNVYLYEDINICGKKLLTSMEPIKEEDSNSMIYLRESRERTLPKTSIKEKTNGLIDKNIENNFESKSEEENNNIKNNLNENKFLGIESEFMMSDSELSEKFNNSNNNKDEKKNDLLNNKENKEKINDNKKLKNNLNENKTNKLKNNERYFNEKMTKDELFYNKILTTKEENHEVEEKEKSLNIEDFNDEEGNENNENIKDISSNLINYGNSKIEKETDNQSNNSYREEDINIFIKEFEDYKKIQKQKIKNYESRLNNIDAQFKTMNFLTNEMNEKINTILQSQMSQKKENHDNLLNNMRNMINDKIMKVFSKFSYYSPFSPPYSMYNEYNIPFNYNTNRNPKLANYRNTNNNKNIKKYKMKSSKNLKSNNYANSTKNK